MVKTLKSKLLPTPYHSLLLWTVWQVLHGFTPGHILLGTVLAIAIPIIVAPLRVQQVYAKKPLLALRYLLVLLGDIVVSNIDVAKRVLQSNRKLRPAFIAFPVELEPPLPLTILTSSISLTPGTVSVELSKDRKWLYIHVLHLDDEQEMIAHIKQRYERPLREVFQC
ncbi:MULTISPECIES: Na+/H+ antiporter subunit E [Aliagarivorans]|uniref:Na+/H+ antiporter subunit E n=1 Tax=Aliagarivorans TaxID=882379 RepID=UPI0004031B60|nr:MULTISPECIES: Na+/H+ antiporter subunit E [Aliagarivorans]